jgi:hypothetical protein
MARELWTRQEMLICLAYYSTMPHPKVVDRLAAKECSKYLPNRSVDSVSLRLANFVARDPEMSSLGFKGMVGGGDKVDQIWNECSSSEKILDWRKVMLALVEVTSERA